MPLVQSKTTVLWWSSWTKVFKHQPSTTVEQPSPEKKNLEWLVKQTLKSHNKPQHPKASHTVWKVGNPPVGSWPACPTTTGHPAPPKTWTTRRMVLQTCTDSGFRKHQYFQNHWPTKENFPLKFCWNTVWHWETTIYIIPCYGVVPTLRNPWL